jgi:peptidoglycan/xylan/chitin deacetylase (PgdA/CDA1 family)
MKRKIATIVLALFIIVSMVSCNTTAPLGTPSVPAETSPPAARPTASDGAELSPERTAPPAPASSPSPSETPGPGKAVIIFTFDDGAVSDYLLAYPILKEYGIKGTSYINAKFTDDNVKGRMSWDQIGEMREYGWVFGAHTCTHQHMTKLSDKQIDKDCEELSSLFTSHGLDAPDIMAYPYGSYNSKVIKAIKPFYKQARLAYYRTDFVDPANTDPYKIPSISADMQSSGRLNELMSLVDKASEEGAVAVFRVHVLYKEHPFDTVKRNPHVGGGCAPQTDSGLFAELVKYCVDKGCSFMTMTELMDYMDAQQG